MFLITVKEHVQNSTSWIFNGNKTNNFSVVSQVLGYNKLICHFNLSIMVSHSCIDIFENLKSVIKKSVKIFCQLLKSCFASLHLSFDIDSSRILITKKKIPACLQTK